MTLTADVARLVERLNDAVSDGCQCDRCRLEREAAALLEALAAERDALRSRLEAARRLREALEGIAFLPGEWETISHIEYCRFCSYSRQWIADKGHGNTCPLYQDAAIQGGTGGGA